MPATTWTEVDIIERRYQATAECIKDYACCSTVISIEFVEPWNSCNYYSYNFNIFNKSKYKSKPRLVTNIWPYFSNYIEMCPEAYVVLELQCPLLVFDFNQNLNVTTTYVELAGITFHEYPFDGTSVVSCGKQRGMANLEMHSCRWSFLRNPNGTKCSVSQMCGDFISWNKLTFIPVTCLSSWGNDQLPFQIPNTYFTDKEKEKSPNNTNVLYSSTEQFSEECVPIVSVSFTVWNLRRPLCSGPLDWSDPTGTFLVDDAVLPRQ